MSFFLHNKNTNERKNNNKLKVTNSKSTSNNFEEKNQKLIKKLQTKKF